MKIKYLIVALFSLGLLCTSCGKKKKGDHKEAIEQKVEQAVPEAGHDDHGHGHDHHGHDH